MKIQLVDKAVAIKLAGEIYKSFQNADEEENIYVYEANNPEILWKEIMALSELKEGEYCVFYNDNPAMEVIETEGEPKVLSMRRFQCDNISKWEVINDKLYLTQLDGEVNIYKYLDDLNGWCKEINPNVV
ncbi:hypothetical protein BH23BAC1_BH23BAC1_43440 [soil metagenome]